MRIFQILLFSILPLLTWNARGDEDIKQLETCADGLLRGGLSEQHLIYVQSNAMKAQLPGMKSGNKYFLTFVNGSAKLIQAIKNDAGEEEVRYVNAYTPAFGGDGAEKQGAVVSMGVPSPGRINDAYGFSPEIEGSIDVPYNPEAAMEDAAMAKSYNLSPTMDINAKDARGLVKNILLANPLVDDAQKQIEDVRKELDPIILRANYEKALKKMRAYFNNPKNHSTKKNNLETWIEANEPTAKNIRRHIDRIIAGLQNRQESLGACKSLKDGTYTAMAKKVNQRLQDVIEALDKSNVKMEVSIPNANTHN